MSERKSRWRELAQPVIAEVLERMKDQPKKEIRRALCAAYPFGERQYHPYRMWLKEIHKVIGKRRHPKNMPTYTQLELFGDLVHD